jgi:hypothetical protein
MGPKILSENLEPVYRIGYASCNRMLSYNLGTAIETVTVNTSTPTLASNGAAGINGLGVLNSVVIRCHHELPVDNMANFLDSRMGEASLATS